MSITKKRCLGLLKKKHGVPVDAGRYPTSGDSRVTDHALLDKFNNENQLNKWVFSMGSRHICLASEKHEQNAA